MEVSYKTPFIKEHEVILELHRIITKERPGAKIIISERGVRKDYTTVSAKIEHEGKETSICQGMVISEAWPLVDLLKSEIIAITLCAAEMGIAINFTGTAQEIEAPDVSMVKEHFKFDKGFILSCGNIPTLKDRMEAMGMDIKPLEAEVKRIRAEGGKISILKAAKFLLGEKGASFYIKSDKENLPVKKTDKPAPKGFKPENLPENTKDTSEVEEIYQRLLSHGISNKDVKAYGFAHVIQFAQYCSQEQIEEIMAKKV